MPPTRIAELSAIIAANTTKIDEYCRLQNAAPPSFEPSVPFKWLLDSSMQETRQAILEATEELNALILGPVGILMSNPVRPKLLLAGPRPGLYAAGSYMTAQLSYNSSSDLSIQTCFMLSTWQG